MYAAIDIGSNTVLLLVAEAGPGVPGGELKVLREEQRMPRLGRNVDRDGRLSDESIRRTLDVLLEYRTILDRDWSATEQIMVTATSAVRDAANRDEFLGLVRRETGFEVRLLSGREEAELTFSGAAAVLEGGYAAPQETTVIDIGGGSTEIACGEHTLRDRWSLDMGCVRYTERYLQTDPPGGDEIEACRRAARDLLQEEVRGGVTGEGLLVGVAGTVTSLGMLEHGLERYDPGRLNGLRITRRQLGKWTSKLCGMTVRRRAELWPAFLEGRADILPAGLLILDEFMNAFAFGEVTVSTGGIRHGAIREMAGF